MPEGFAGKLGYFEDREMAKIPAGTDRYLLFRCKDEGFIAIAKIYEKMKKSAAVCKGCRSGGPVRVNTEGDQDGLATL